MASKSEYDAIMTRGLVTLNKKLVTYTNPTHSFFTKYLFGKQGITTSDDTYSWKYDKKTSKLIGDTRRGDNATVLNQSRDYKYIKYTFPYMFYEDSVNRTDRKILAAGENPAKPWSESKRLLYKMNDKVETIKSDMDTVIEKWCTDILLTGKIEPEVKENGDVEFLKVGDTNFPISKNIYSETSGNYWNADGVSIYARIQAHIMQFFKRRGIMPDTLIVPMDIVDLLYADEKIYKMLDNRNSDFGKLAPLQITADGYSEIAQLKWPGCTLRIISYVGFYFDKAGTQTDYMPKNKVILTRRNIGSINYGGLEGIDNIGMPISVAGKERVEVNKTTKTPVRYSVSVQRAPLPVPEVLDGWATIQVTA